MKEMTLGHGILCWSATDWSKEVTTDCTDLTDK